MEILSVYGGRFPRVTGVDATAVCVNIAVSAAGSWTSSHVRNLQRTQFGAIQGYIWQTGATGAKCVVLDGDNAANPSVAIPIQEVEAIHKDGVGVHLKSSDTYSIQQIDCYRVSGGTGAGVRIEGGDDTANYARHLMIGLVQPGTGGFRFAAGSTTSPKAVKIAFYSLGNASPAATIDQGCGADITYSNGVKLFCGDAGVASITGRRINAAAGQSLFDLISEAYDAGGTLRTLARMRAYYYDSTAGSADGWWLFSAMKDGALNDELTIRGGLVVGAPTGGAKGVGTLNAVGVYDDNTLLTDYVFDRWLNRDKAYPEKVQARAAALDPAFFDLSHHLDFIRAESRLYGMPGLDETIDGKVDLPLGAMVQRLWQAVEIQMIHIAELHGRLKQLENPDATD